MVSAQQETHPDGGQCRDVPAATQISIGDAGFDAFWLQDEIYGNPPCLGLGELEAIP